MNATRQPHFPPPTFEDVPEDRRKVKVTKPTENGEIIVRGAVPVDEFRDGGAAPRRPEPLGPEPQEPVGTLGWICARWSDYLLARRAYKQAIRRGALPPAEYEEAETDYWAYYAKKLMRVERSNLASGRVVAIVRPVEPIWKRGDVLTISNKQRARVEAITRTLKGWRTEFAIEDFRAFFMKRAVSGGSKPKTDDQGYAAEPTAAEIERARLDGAYTQAEEQAVPDGGEVLEDRLHRRLHQEQSMKNAMAQSKGRVRASRFRLEERLNEARKNHRRSTARYLERQLASLAEKEGKQAEKKAPV